MTERQYCDFFVWSKNESFCIRVFRNESFINQLKVKFEKIFKECILPELVCRRMDPDFENQENVYCICKRPYFDPMIACDAPGCELEWYHYSCVNIKRAPNGKWICPSCKKRN